VIEEIIDFIRLLLQKAPLPKPNKSRTLKMAHMPNAACHRCYAIKCGMSSLLCNKMRHVIAATQ